MGKMCVVRPYTYFTLRTFQQNIVKNICDVITVVQVINRGSAKREGMAQRKHVVRLSEEVMINVLSARRHWFEPRKHNMCHGHCKARMSQKPVQDTNQVTFIILWSSDFQAPPSALSMPNRSVQFILNDCFNTRRFFFVSYENSLM
jgi:hypothetical protein